MSAGLTVTKRVHFRRGPGRKKTLREGRLPETRSLTRVPRVSRLMALAIRMQELVDAGEVEDYAELARLAHVTRARMTQIMNLLLLAPDIQEELLFLPETDGRCCRITERRLRPITPTADWNKQRRLWERIRSTLSQ